MCERKNNEVKYVKTESNCGKNKLFKDEMTQFNYRLFKSNEKNRKNNLYMNKRQKLNIILKNNNNDNTYHLKTLTNFTNIALRNTINKEKNESSIKYNYLPTMNINYFPKSRIKKIIFKKTFPETDNKNLCLVPVYFLHKNKLKQNKTNNINTNRKNLSSAKSLKIKTLNQNKILNKFLNKKNKRRSETEENDMKPKIRFINFKKELLDETLKINKMFGNYRRQIIEIEKEIKGQINRLYI
jgi:hypothetical protein